MTRFFIFENNDAGLEISAWSRSRLNYHNYGGHPNANYTAFICWFTFIAYPSLFQSFKELPKMGMAIDYMLTRLDYKADRRFFMLDQLEYIKATKDKIFPKFIYNNNDYLPPLKPLILYSDYTPHFLESDFLDPRVLLLHPINKLYSFYFLNLELTVRDKQYIFYGNMFDRHNRKIAFPKTLLEKKANAMGAGFFDAGESTNYNIVASVKETNIDYSNLINALEEKTRYLTSKYIKICLKFLKNEHEIEQLFNLLREYLPIFHMLDEQHFNEINEICIKILFLIETNVIIKEKYKVYEEIINFILTHIERRYHGIFAKLRYGHAIDNILKPCEEQLSILRRLKEKKNYDVDLTNDFLELYRREGRTYMYRTQRLTPDRYPSNKLSFFSTRYDPVTKKKINNQEKRLYYEAKNKALKKQPIMSRMAEILSRPLTQKLYLSYIYKVGLDEGLDKTFKSIFDNCFPKIANPNRGFPHFKYSFKVRVDDVAQGNAFYALAALCKLTNKKNLSVVNLMTEQLGYPIKFAYHYNLLFELTNKEVAQIQSEYDILNEAYFPVYDHFQEIRIRSLRQLQNYYTETSNYSELAKTKDKAKKKYLLKSISLGYVATVKFWIARFIWWNYTPPKTFRHEWLSYKMNLYAPIRDLSKRYVEERAKLVVFPLKEQCVYFKRTMLGSYDKASTDTIISIMDEYIMKDKNFDMFLKEKVRSHILEGKNLKSLLIIKQIPKEFHYVFFFSKDFFYEFTIDNEKAREYVKTYLKYKNWRQINNIPSITKSSILKEVKPDFIQRVERYLNRFVL